MQLFFPQPITCVGSKFKVQTSVGHMVFCEEAMFLVTHTYGINNRILNFFFLRLCAFFLAMNFFHLCQNQINKIKIKKNKLETCLAYFACSSNTHLFCMHKAQF